MEEIEQEQHKFRTNFYRDHYRGAVNFLIILITICLIQAGVLYYLVKSRHYPDAYSSSVTGHIAKLSPLSQPNLSIRELYDWSKQVILTAYSFNFTNFQKTMASIENNFTDAAWLKFSTYRGKSGYDDAIMNNNIFANAEISGVPKVMKQGTMKDRFMRYTWELQIPLTVTYKNGTNAEQQQLTIDVTIEREPNVDKPNAVAITNLKISGEKVPFAAAASK